MKKKFYIAEIVVATVLIGLFIAALFIHPHFTPEVTPGEAHFFTIYIRGILVFASGVMGYVIINRVLRLKNPVYDYKFLFHYDD